MVDYSKFDKIEDSDDEKPDTSAKTASKAADKPVEKPHCHNCHKDIVKPLRCGVCKKVEYCSAACQKSDWTYHKRVCKKPEELKPKSEPSKPRPPEERKPKKEEKVVDNDEIVDWYRHREWKPTTEEKKEFKPTQITAEAAKAATTETAKTAHDGSVWNAAGTWEEKDVTALAQNLLKDKLQTVPVVDAAGGQLSSEVTDAVEGEASKPVIRGKRRHLFDLTCKVKFSFKWMDSEGQQKAEGSVKVSDFTNDTFTEGVMEGPVVKLSFTDAKLLDQGRRQAVEAAVGAASWPPADGTLMAHVSARMNEFATEFAAME